MIFRPHRFAACLILLAAFFQCLSMRVGAANERWNILFIFADDWGRYASCYQGLDGRPTLNDVVKTPHVDAVAREGTLFRNCYVNAPSCTPCRSSLLSGRYFFQCALGSILNGAVWDPNIPSFPLLLLDSGYQIGKSYKVWSPGRPADAPIGGQKYAYEKAGLMPQHFSNNAMPMVGKGATVQEVHEKVKAQVRGNFDAFLADRKPGRPWLYFFGPTTTHRTWIKGSGKVLWGIEPDSLKGKMPKFLPDVPEVREDVADYLGECQAVDEYVGVLMDRLKEIGELDHTIVVISGDHGMPGVPSGKCNLYDHGVSVALVVRMPGGKAGRVVDDLVRLPDLAPTFMEIGGVKPPENLYGRSLLPLLQSDQSGQIDPSRTWAVTGRERHVAKAREGNLPYPMRALHTKDFVYIRNFKPDRWPMGSPGQVTETSEPSQDDLEHNTFVAFADMDGSPTKAWLVQHRHDSEWRWLYELAFGKRPMEELYDLRTDPDMINNIADESKYAETKQQMSTQLMKILQEAKDPRVSEDPVFEKPPYTNAADEVLPKRAKQAAQ